MSLHTSETRDLRQKILTAAAQLFIQQGYHGLAMRQIAEVVGVSKAALYYHFRDKEELFLAILAGYLDDMETLIDRVQAEGGTSRELIQRLVRRILNQPAEQRAVIRLASQEMAQLQPAVRESFNQTYHAKFLNKIRAIFQTGMERGELRPLDPGLATWTFLGMMYPYFYPAQSHEMQVTDKVLNQMIAIFLDGIASPMV